MTRARLSGEMTGSHLHALIEAEPDDARLGFFANGIEKGLVRGADRNRQRRREASLSGAAKCAVGNDIGSGREISVRQNHHRVLRAALTLRALPRRRRSRVDLTGDRARSHELTDRTAG